MIVNLFSIFDKVAGIYMAPFVARSTVDAIRQIRASRDDPNMKFTPVLEHPSEFALYSLGSFDDVNGVVSDIAPSFISDLSDIWNVSPPPVTTPVVGV